MYIIVPYRNRKNNLDKFLKTCSTLSFEWKTTINIIVVEQTDNEPFNRGFLLNCGLHYLKNHDKNCIAVTHDVDIYPKINAKDLYAYSDSVCHLYGHSHSFGGIVLSTLNNFFKVNGYSNNYKGWGREDVDFKMRCETFNVDIDNSRFQKRYDKTYFNEKHSKPKRKNPNNIDYFNKSKKNIDVYSYDGLNQIDDSIYIVEHKNNATWLKVHNTDLTHKINNEKIANKVNNKGNISIKFLSLRSNKK